MALEDRPRFTMRLRGLKADLWAGLLTVAVGLVFLALIPAEIRDVRSDALITGRFFPTCVGIFLVSLGFALMLAKTSPRGRQEPVASSDEPPSWAHLGGYLAIVAGYFAGIYLVGFEIATFLVLIALMRYSGFRNWFVAGLVSLITVGILYLLFHVLMQMPLPESLLG